MDLINSVVGAGSFIAGLMLYAGYIYANAYFGYFRLDSFAVGFDTFELVMRSLRLATLPVLEILTLLLLVPALPRLLTVLRIPARHIERLRGAGRAVARAHLVPVAAGALLLLLWRWIQPYGWAAPLLVVGGLLLGQAPAAGPRAIWERTVSLLLAGLFLVWVVALVAGQLGRQDAGSDAALIVRRPSVVILSTDRLSIAPPGPGGQDLGEGAHYRYRYEGLRLLIERGHRYYLLPVHWRRGTDPVYVIADDSSVRVEIRPGVLPKTH
ncbi:hypothetical protein GTY65_34455 [Streptomyces sp. SID8379]|uniref:hypothetical protein n=1 Tax=unclassified Streptomyces TaxID=2593676 RepID=UPI00036CD849|nr:MULTISPECIES: hypothetical protein [unclassified Streptomyces]MYW69139.1 hypothetical protein [Streptomyces sp. SID8379]